MKHPLTIYLGDTFKGRINEDALITHKSSSPYNWPNTLDGPNADVNQVFTMEWTYDGWRCEAVGFGLPPCFGNGEIIVLDQEDVSLICTL